MHNLFTQCDLHYYQFHAYKMSELKMNKYCYNENVYIMCIPNIFPAKENISNTETTSSDFTLHRLNQHYPISPKYKEHKNFSSFHPHLTSGLTKLEPTRAYLSQKTPLEHPWPSNTSQINESK